MRRIVVIPIGAALLAVGLIAWFAGQKAEQPPITAHVKVVSWQPPGADRAVASFANDQARYYLRQMGWASPRPQHGPQPLGALPFGVVVAKAKARQQALQATPAGTPVGDGYVLTTGTGWARIDANNARGLLYGVYAYLQKLGVRFFAPNFSFYRDIANEVIPRHPASLPPAQITSSPSFPIRRLDTVLAGGTASNTVAIADWAAKQGINTLLLPLPGVPGQRAEQWSSWRAHVLPALRQRGLMLETGRTYNYLLPWSRYRRKHPRWFFGPEFNKAFCASEPGALQAYVANTVDVLRQSPQLVRFDAWPPDVTQWCPQDLKRIGPAPAIQAVILRALDAGVRAAGLQVRIETVAYDTSGTLTAPRGGLPPGVQVDFAPYNRSFAEPLWGPANRGYWQALTGWLHTHPRVGDYTYYVKGAWLSRPVLIPQLIAQELRRFASMRLNAVSSYADSGSWLAYELNHLATAQFSWNANLSYNDFLRDYTRHRFGPAARAASAYVRQTELGAQAVFTDARGGFRSKPQLKAALRHWGMAARALDSTEKILPGDTRTTQLVDRLRVSLSLGILDASTAAAQLAGRPATLDEKAADTLLTKAVSLGLVEGIVPNNFAVPTVTTPHKPWGPRRRDANRSARSAPRQSPPSARSR